MARQSDMYYLQNILSDPQMRISADLNYWYFRSPGVGLVIISLKTGLIQHKHWGA
jgi:hypothetical protein